MFVIRGPNGFVNKSGSYHSYTKFIEQARKFSTKEDAEKDKCGNETVIDVYKYIGD